MTEKSVTAKAGKVLIDETTPENLLLKREDAAALYRAMEALAESDRELLTLYCFYSAVMADMPASNSLYVSLQNTGVQYGSDLNRDYPDFQFGDYPDFQVETVTGESIQQHFESLLQYLIDHPKLADMADASSAVRSRVKVTAEVTEK